MAEPKQEFDYKQDPYDEKEGSLGVGSSNELRTKESQQGIASKQDTDESSKLDSSSLGKAESLNTGAGSSLYNPSDKAHKRASLKNFFWGSRRRKIATSGTGVTGTLIGGLIGLLMVAAGPAQLVQLSHVLQGDFSGMDGASSNRFGRLFAFSGDDIGETRLGVLGRQFLKPTLSKLQDMGIEFKTNGSGGVRSVSINTDQLKAANPDLQGLSDEDLKSYLGSQLSVDPANITGSGSTFTIDASTYGNPVELPINVTRLIKNGSLDLLDNGSILTAISKRVLGKYFDVESSLFHPISAAKSAARKSVTSAVESRQQESKDAEDGLIEPADAETGLSSIRGTLSDFFDGSVGNAISGALIGTAALCTIRTAASYVVEFNRAAIVVPAALEATRYIAIGDEVESGQDITGQQVGGLVDSLTDSSGKSVWDAMSLQVTEQHQDPSGPDLPTDYAQAFSGNTTANNIINGIDLNAGGINWTGAVCSPVGQGLQALVGITELIAAAPSGGSSLALYAVQKTAETAGMVGSIYFLEHHIEDILKDNAIVPSLLSGPLGGNLMAYGAREAGNIGARSEGGVALSNSDTTAETTVAQAQSDKQFASESLFDRIFDIDDNRTLLGRLADAISPRLSVNISNFSSDILNIGGMFSAAFDSIMPHVSADTTYNWGFPEDGIPSSILNNTDPSMQNPYENADDVSSILSGSSGQGYITSAENCFGVNLTETNGEWDAIPNNDVNPDSSSYVQSNGNACNDTSDPNWQRIILFILDTRTMQSDACYEGDSQSCSEVGF